MSEGRALLAMGALALMWGSSFFWIKIGLNAFSPTQLVLVRLVLGAAVLMALCLAQRHRLPAGRRLWAHLAVAALFHNAVPFLLFAIGEQTVNSGVTGVLNATTPLWALAVALVWGLERRPGRAQLGGLLLGFAGVLLIFAPWSATGLVSWGALAILAASASYGFVMVYEGRFLADAGASPIALAGAQMLTASGFLLLVMPVAGTTPIRLEPGALAAVAVLGVFSTGIAFALNYRLIAAQGAVATSTVGYLLPVVSVLLGTLLLDEALSPRVVAGMVVVLVGVALSRRRPAPVAVPAAAEPHAPAR
ncbi:DMT family transporter [Amycolatopsis arida]|uniref:DMT family transporter n=1 Tax=Amycolatopsis arida TaxID=587909 RepID=UPI000B8124EE|nr:EamA family transporter [Amycolatopsis arida]